MKKLLLLALPYLLIQAAAADDQLRNVQTELKNQGFYYGDVNGQESTETSAAIRRYQIRNGLQVTGTLNAETMHALGLRGGATKPQVAPPSPSAPPAARRPAPDESDRNFLREEEQRSPAPGQPSQAPQQRPSDPSVVPPPAPMTEPSEDFAALFASTPYFNAPREVQRETLRRAQAMLALQGYYRDPVNGLPSVGTEEALLRFQRHTRLPLSGRLDLQTLDELRLLPGRGLRNPPLQPFYPNNTVRDYPRQRVYRGIPVD